MFSANSQNLVSKILKKEYKKLYLPQRWKERERKEERLKIKGT